MTDGWPQPEDPVVIDGLEPGDRLWIRPPVGSPYSARVVETTDEHVRVSVPDGREHRTRWLPGPVLDNWFLIGDLLVNPDRPARV